MRRLEQSRQNGSGHPARRPTHHFAWYAGFWLLITLASDSRQAGAQIPPGTYPPAEDPVVSEARRVALHFANAIPDFICQEVMSRFENEAGHPAWRPLDVITANLVYQNGKENYQDVTINGKPANKRMEQLRGAWSTGEFGSILVQLFSPETAAHFHARGNARMAGKNVGIYDFDVLNGHSQWMIEVAGQSILPPYGGSVWIEPETGRVIRIEMRASGLPIQFPAERVESSTDYQDVPIGDQQYLLPAHSETLTCTRGSLLCARNVIYFVNYHKYGSQSSIHFGGGKQ